MVQHGQRWIDGYRIARIVGSVVLFALLVMLLFPRTLRQPRRRLQPTCAQRLKLIGAALRRYAVNYDRYPPQALLAPDGTPLLSWRVLILPYMGEGLLYRRFRLDEPWDSAHNKALLLEIPPVYRCPLGHNIPQSQTSYLGISGPNAIFITGPSGIANSQLHDPLVSTMIVAEFHDQPVPWTKPVDAVAEEIGPVAQPGGIGNDHSSGGFILCADGKVHLLTPEIPEAVWRATLTRNGGEPPGWPINYAGVD